jgi:hypothetical protein
MSAYLTRHVFLPVPGIQLWTTADNDELAWRERWEGRGALCGWREAWEEAKDGREGRIGASMGGRAGWGERGKRKQGKGVRDGTREERWGAGQVWRDVYQYVGSKVKSWKR